MNKFLSIESVAELAVNLANKLNMKKVPTVDSLIQIMSKRNALPEVFADEMIRIWVDRLYVAYSYEHLPTIHYVYITHNHIREETVSFIEAGLERNINISLPFDIQEQFINAALIMKNTGKNYLILDA